MPLSEKDILVHIGDNDAIIDRQFLDCLFQTSGTLAYLNDEVITVITNLYSVSLKHHSFLLQYTKFLFSLLTLGVHLKLQVINACISLMRSENHLKSGAGGTVFMETTFNSAILNRDGNKDILIDENDKIETKSKERMVSLYTDHDMVSYFF
jgi:hypothetical protein